LASLLGHTTLRNAGLTYANRVDELAQIQQSKLRGQAMATCDFLTSGFASGTATSGNWFSKEVAVGMGYKEPIPLTPIQQIREGLKSWLKPLL